MAKEGKPPISLLNARKAFDRTQRKLGIERCSLDLVLNIHLQVIANSIPNSKK